LFIGLALVGAFVALPEALAQQTVNQNVDRPGLDYDNFDMRANNPDLCKQACFADTRCKAWAFVKPNTGQGPKPRCWLKTGAPNPVNNSCCASEVIQAQAPTPPHRMEMMAAIHPFAAKSRLIPHACHKARIPC
jgi:hypothetical protein